jgi:hypothetical protein
MREKRRGNADSSSTRSPRRTTIRVPPGAPPTNLPTGSATPTRAAEGSAPPSGSSASQKARKTRSSGARRPATSIQAARRGSRGTEISQHPTATPTREPSTMKFNR